MFIGYKMSITLLRYFNMSQTEFLRLAANVRNIFLIKQTFRHKISATTLCLTVA